jgi:UDP-N-acetylmuramoylalanine--D-glutamate ligase
MKAVFGLGKSALSVIRYLKSIDVDFKVINQGDITSWYDQVSDFVIQEHCIAQKDLSDHLIQISEIIISPGIPSKLEVLQEARKMNIPVISEIEFAYRNSKVPVIAVTGTNGKTTVCEMLFQALKTAGKNVFLGGNIGIPYTDIIGKDYDFAVIEVSSFQLETIATFKPLISVITNITPSHMERYDSFEEYRDTKFKITQNMSKKLVYTTQQFDIEGERLVTPLEFDYYKTKAFGEHNQKNFSLVYTILEQLKLEDKIDFQDFIDNFTPSPYRIEYRGSHGDCRFYNDGKSTNIDSTLAALRSIESDCGVLILGGKLRDDAFDFSKIHDFKDVYEVWAFGDAKDLIYKELSSIFKVKVFEKLEDIFKEIDPKKFDAILFSPSFPSFDLYSNYIARAEHFNQLVAEFISPR